MERARLQGTSGRVSDLSVCGRFACCRGVSLVVLGLRSTIELTNWPFFLLTGWTDGGEWLVEFWYEDDARSFEERPPQLSTGHLLSIVPYNPRRAPPPALIPAAPSQATALSSYYTPSHSRTPSAGFSSGPLSPLSVGAPAFVPSASGSPRAPLSGVNMWPTSPGVEMGGGAYNPGLGLGLGSPTGLGLSTFGPGQQVQPAPVQGPGSTSASGLIDPCNLFCKVHPVAQL